MMNSCRVDRKHQRIPLFSLTHRAHKTLAQHLLRTKISLKQHENPLYARRGRGALGLVLVLCLFTKLLLPSPVVVVVVLLFLFIDEWNVSHFSSSSNQQ